MRPHLQWSNSPPSNVQISPLAALVPYFDVLSSSDTPRRLLTSENGSEAKQQAYQMAIPRKIPNDFTRDLAKMLSLIVITVLHLVCCTRSLRTKAEFAETRPAKSPKCWASASRRLTAEYPLFLPSGP